MSGNLWMFSDMLDDEDIEMQKHDFITLYQGADYYGLGLKVFTRMAREAGSVYKIGKKALIRRTIFDEYLRKVYKKELEKNSSDDSGKELILAPIKGHEFRRACNAVGGQFIRIAPGSPHCINIMEIRHTIAPEMELIDAMDYVELGSMLANKIQQLMIFFSLLIPDMTNEEEQLLDEALIKTYADFGITHDNESVYEDATVTPPKMKQMPISGLLIW